MHKQDINETITWNKTRILKLQRKKSSKEMILIWKPICLNS
jgi:hypothetical protein